MEKIEKLIQILIESIYWGIWGFAVILSFVWMGFPIFIAIQHSAYFILIFCLLTIPSGALLVYLMYLIYKEMTSC